MEGYVRGVRVLRKDEERFGSPIWWSGGMW